MPVLGISTITNRAAGLAEGALDHRSTTTARSRSARRGRASSADSCAPAEPPEGRTPIGGRKPIRAKERPEGAYAGGCSGGAPVVERLGKGGVRIGVGTGAGGVEHRGEIAAPERPRVEAQPRKDAALNQALFRRVQ